MHHEPHEQFDHAVLDLIEHSPTGAVPVTPAYQDALKRLYGAHKVYASADHKDGHVTARSLAGRACFHASNMEAVAEGLVAPELLEANAAIFDRYVLSLEPSLRPGAEAHRLKVIGHAVHHRAKHLGAEKLPAVHDFVHTIFMVPGCGPHPGLPGNYLYGTVVQVKEDGEAGSWVLHVHDRDDGQAVREAATCQASLTKLQELVECAPFAMDELKALGFRIV